MYTLIGSQWRNYKIFVERLLLNLKSYSYSFMPEDKFDRVVLTFPSEAKRIYWDEILYRAHYSAIIAILRSHKWAEGVQISYENKNYLSFCANLRGLLESASDSFDSLGAVPKFIAMNFNMIKSPYTKFLCPELEDALIHFSHGRRIKKGDDAPESHKAKSPTEYLRAFDPKDNSRFYDLYRELCETTHPAARTVLMFLKPIDKKGGVITLSDSYDEILILDFLDRYRTIIDEFLEYALNLPFVLLKILNFFGDRRIETKNVEMICFDNIKLWTECKEILREQGVYQNT